MRYKFLLLLVVLLKLHLSVADINTDDYAFLAQRRMINDINFSELQVTFVHDRYEDMMDIILDIQQRIYQEIYQEHERLTLMQAMNPTYRYCIQRYKPKMYTREQAQEQFNVCLNAAEIKSHKLLLDVETPLNFAKNTANVQLPMAIETCQEYSSNGTLQEECVVAKVEAHSETFDEDLNDVEDKLEVNLGLTALVARNAMECSFEVEKKVLVKIGSSLQQIDSCLEDMQLSAISGVVYN